jgi:hypothetical protein
MNEWEQRERDSEILAEKDHCDYYGYQVALNKAEQNALNTYLADSPVPKELDTSRSLLEWSLNNPQATKDDVVQYAAAVQKLVGDIFNLVKKWCVDNDITVAV